MSNLKTEWSLTRVVKYLRQIHPHVAHNSEYFALDVILFSAAVLQNTDIDTLSRFTGCSRDFVHAIAHNMRNNSLWTDGKYNCSGWFKNGVIIDDGRFFEETQAAEGSLWFPFANFEDTLEPLSFDLSMDCHLLWENLIRGTELRLEKIVAYFSQSPDHGPRYLFYSEEQIVGAGGIHALESKMWNETYWFARLGTVEGVQRPSGVSIEEKVSSTLPKPGVHGWRIGRRNPAAGGGEFEICIFNSLFNSLQVYLDTWKRRKPCDVESYAVKQIKISRNRVFSLASAFRARGRASEVLSMEVLKYRSLPYGGLGTEVVVGEFPLTVPVQLRWSAGEKAIAADILPVGSC